MSKKRLGFREYLNKEDPDTLLIIAGGMPAPKTVKGLIFLLILIAVLTCVLVVLVNLKG